MLKEAIKSGTPVVTSPFLEETVGGHAIILEDPTSRAQTVQALRRAISDEKLHDALSSEGLEWIKELSWDNVAIKSLKFIENCYKN